MGEGVGSARLMFRGNGQTKRKSTFIWRGLIFCEHNAIWYMALASRYNVRKGHVSLWHVFLNSQLFSSILLKLYFWSEETLDGWDTFSQIYSFPSCKLTAFPQKATGGSAQLFLRLSQEQLTVRATCYLPALSGGLPSSIRLTASRCNWHSLSLGPWRSGESILKVCIYPINRFQWKLHRESILPGSVKITQSN